MIHEVRDYYVISAYGSWLPGAYESERAARFAFRFSYEELQVLQNIVNERAGGVGGNITWEDLKTFSRILKG